MKLVADANVLLAAVLGGQAKTVLQHPEIDEVLTAEATLAEVEEYARLFWRGRNACRWTRCSLRSPRCP